MTLLKRCYESGQSFLVGGDISRYLAAHSQFMRHLLALIHLSSGGPARCTEFCSYTIVNNGPVQRSVFFDAERVFLVAGHNKNNVRTVSNNRIPRFLAPEDSLIVLRELLFVRPFLLFLLQKGNNNTAMRAYANFLFVADGSRVRSTQASRIFSQGMATMGRVIIGFGNFRHLATLVTHRHKLGVKDDRLTDNSTQLGHSRETSERVYGRSDMDGPVKEMALVRHRQASINWQRFILEAASPEVPV